MYYVSMVDTFLSGWGRADGKISVVVVKCSSLSEAEECKELNDTRSDMNDVEISTVKPCCYEHPEKYDVEERDFNHDSRYRF